MTVWTGKRSPWAPSRSLRTTTQACSTHPSGLWRTSTASPQRPTSSQADSGRPSSCAGAGALQLGCVTLAGRSRFCLRQNAAKRQLQRALSARTQTGVPWAAGGHVRLHLLPPAVRRMDPARMRPPGRPQPADERAARRQGPLRPPAAPRPLEQLPAHLNLRAVHEHRNPAPRRSPMPNDGRRDPTHQAPGRRQRPRRLAVPRPATPGLDRHALRQIPERTQPLRRQGQRGAAPETGQAGVRELAPNLQRAGRCACRRRTCRVVFAQPAFCRKNPCTVRLSKHFNDFLSGDQGITVFIQLVPVIRYAAQPPDIDTHLIVLKPPQDTGRSRMSPDPLHAQRTRSRARTSGHPAATAKKRTDSRLDPTVGSVPGQRS